MSKPYVIKCIVYQVTKNGNGKWYLFSWGLMVNLKTMTKLIYGKGNYHKQFFTKHVLPGLQYTFLAGKTLHVNISYLNRLIFTVKYNLTCNVSCKG